MLSTKNKSNSGRWLRNAAVDFGMIACLPGSLTGPAVFAQAPVPTQVSAHTSVSSSAAAVYTPSDNTPIVDESADARVDQSDWSEIRVKAYEHSLEVPFPSPLAVLSVPRLRLRAPMFEGTDDVTLDRGVGRISGTALPGEVGNIGVAGHRDGFFRLLKDIQVGDTIELATSSGIATYRVKQLKIVDPHDIDVLKSTSDRTLTLVTCYPFYFSGHAPNRFIVEASLIQPLRQ